MGDGWDLLCNAADLVRWMDRNGFAGDRYSPPDEWTFPVLIGFCYSVEITDGPYKHASEPSWLIVELNAARRLIAVAAPGGEG